MTIFSSSLISELKTFVASGGSYAAKLGETDDLVMASLLVVRLLQHLQSYHADLDNHMRDHSEEIEPMPFIAVF
jgi:cell division protein ZapA (FtsZ GTPase activity inhibitor)